MLSERVDEARGHNLDFVHLFFQKEVAGKGGNRAGFGEARRVGVGEVGDKLAACGGDELRGFTASRDEQRSRWVELSGQPKQVAVERPA